MSLVVQPSKINFYYATFILLVNISFSEVVPCSTYTCDSLTVHAIFWGYPENEISIDSSGRISGISMSDISQTALPPEIGKLTNLTLLLLGNNKLNALPPEIGKLKNLTSLFLYHTQLTALPSEIGQLNNLTQLHLFGNQLTTLPPEIGQLKNLKRLDVSSNQLTTLPPEIGQLTNLMSLNLFFNQLTTLPPEIINLGKGAASSPLSLQINANRLCSVPDSIETWINIATSLSPDWRVSQLLDDSTKCDGTPKTSDIEQPSRKAAAKGFNIHRNPFNQSVTLTFNSPQPKTLTIYNISGEFIKRFNDIQASVTWRTEDHEKGVYYIRAVINEKSVIGKVVL